MSRNGLRADEQRATTRAMAMLIEFLPILAFFVTLKFTDVFIATAVAVVATIGAAIYQRATTGKVETMTLVSCGLMVVFGGLTIALHDETFVKWKPTVLMVLFALAFLVSRYVGEKPLAQRMLGKAFEAERPIWLRVNDGLTGFFLMVAGLNLWVAYTFSTDTWATFKLIGLIIMNLAAIMVAAWYLGKHGKVITPEATAKVSEGSPPDAKPE